MFNPDKQTRNANGRFGAKKVEAEIEDIADAVVQVGKEVVEAVEASYKSINERINSGEIAPGQIVPFDYPQGGLSYWQIGALAIAALAAIYVLASVIF